MYKFDNNMINFEDDIVKVYKGRKIVFHGQFDSYFYNDEFDEDFEYDRQKKVYIGHGKAEGWKVRKVK